MSTPQMICVTVTFLVSATECHATVRSCVTWAAVPGLSDGEKSPQDEREPSARGGTDPSVPPPQQSQPNNCRSSRDTRMTLSLVVLRTTLLLVVLIRTLLLVARATPLLLMVLAMTLLFVVRKKTEAERRGWWRLFWRTSMTGCGRRCIAGMGSRR